MIILSNFFINKSLFDNIDDTWELIIDNYPSTINNNKILVLCEPKSITRQFYTLAKYHHTKFKYILTYDKSILSTIPNAYLCLFGTIRTLENTNTNKDFRVSMLLTEKRHTNAHLSRYTIFNNQLNYKPDKLFLINKHVNVKYLSPNIKRRYCYGRGVIQDLEDKSILFNTCQYHLAIENCSIDNYFTEKLLDCFITMTIPIYYGCKNIDQYFDINGMIILENLDIDTITTTINNLTPETYTEKMNSIISNYNRCKMYSDYALNIKSTLNSITDFNNEKI
jgi:hypothetical protein